MRGTYIVYDQNHFPLIGVSKTRQHRGFEATGGDLKGFLFPEQLTSGTHKILKCP